MEYRQKIISLLKSKDSQYWLTAMMIHKQGGFITDDAWRWFVYAMFCSAGFDDAAACYSGFIEMGATSLLRFNFSTINLDIEVLQWIDGEKIEEDIYKTSLVFDKKEAIVNTIKIHADDLKKLLSYLPKMKPYSNYGWIDDTGQAFLYGLLCHTLAPYKQDIIRYLHIDTNYVENQNKG